MRPSTRSLAAIALLVLPTLLAGCGGDRIKKQINPPEASIQQLTVQPNGQWRLVVRLQNFSNVPATFNSATASLKFGGQDAGSISLSPNMSIGPESADTVEANLTPALGAKLAVASALSASQSIRYEMRGQIVTSQRGGGYDFVHEGALNPAPGLPGVLR